MNTKRKSSILIIYTGGTIGMKVDPVDQTLKPFDFSQILEEVPELSKFACKIDSYTFDPLIDSSDVEPSMWQNLAGVIRDRYDRYDGFLVLHGTDTMSYSASALSFMLDGLDKPVIFTGSQLPIGVPRTDGKENLISAVEIASAKTPEGEAVVPEVCIFFGAKLMRGNRTTKVSAEQFDAFTSPNLPPTVHHRHAARHPGFHLEDPSRHHAPGRQEHPPRSGNSRRHHRNLWLRQRSDEALVPGYRPGGPADGEGTRERNSVPQRLRQHESLCHGQAPA